MIKEIQNEMIALKIQDRPNLINFGSLAIKKS